MMFRFAIALIFVAAALGGAYFAGHRAGVDAERADWQAAQLAQDVKDKAVVSKVRGLEQELYALQAGTEKDRTDALATLADDYRRLAIGVSSRPRRPELSSTAEAVANVAGSTGATGAALYAEDGAFLAGEAARADTLRVSLRSCYDQYGDALRTVNAATP